VSGKILNVKRKGQSLSLRIVASLALVFLFAAPLSAQEEGSTSSPELSIGSLSELADKRRALLIIKRAAIVDARGGVNSLIEEALKSDPRLSRRYRLTYNIIAGKLNRFMKKYKSISAAQRIEEADYVIFFNLLEYRRPLGIPHPFGELYVIANAQPGARGGPRLVWKSRKARWAEDAMDELLDELKLLRKES
jgi:hypothetical protein